MKAKLIALVALFFALSLAAWSYVPVESGDDAVDTAAQEWPELPNCSGRDRGDAGAGAKPGVSTGKRTLTPQENPIETSFLELTCLLASN